MNGSSLEPNAYGTYIARKYAFIAVCVVLSIIGVGLTCAVGTRSIEFFDVYRIMIEHLSDVEYIWGTPEWFDDYVICQVRLPRAIAGAIAGGALALAGLAMQGVLKNPLADAYTTGVSSGACLGAVMAIALGMSVVGGSYAIVMNAFLMSLIPVAVMTIVSNRISGNPTIILLAGTAISMFFGSLTSLILLTVSSEDMQAAFLWQIGSLENTSWADVPMMLILTVVCSIYIQLTSRRINAINSGDSYATSLGVDVRRYRISLMIMVSLMVSSVVSFTGILGFVGVVVPHIVRLVIGGDNRFLVIPSVALGATLMVVSDAISKVVVFPVGVILSFIGAPIFLSLVIRMRRSEL